jgi:hypothetical protein
MGFDPLHPPDPWLDQVPIKTTPFQHRSEEAFCIRSSHWEACPLRVAVHNELSLLFQSNPQHFDMSAFTTGNPDLIAIIQVKIKELAGAEILRKLDAKFKFVFPDPFPDDIPHVRDLPKSEKMYANSLALSGTSQCLSLILLNIL